MRFVISLLLTLVALVAFCIVLPGIMGMTGPDTFVPGVIIIFLIGVGLGGGGARVAS
jgi:hypothetical protein